MAGGFSAGLAGLSAAYPAYVQGQSDQIDLADKKASATALAASNFVAQLLGGSSLGTQGPQPPPPGQGSQPAPQGPPPPGPPTGPAPGQPPGRMPFMGGQVPQFGGPPGPPGGPQMPQMPPTQVPSPGGLPIGAMGRGPSPMGPQGFGPQAAAPQPQGQPPMSPGMGAGARPPGGAAPPGGQQGTLNLQTFMQAYQQAAQKHPELNNPGVFIKTAAQFAPLLQLADREQLMNIREQSLQQQEQRLTQMMQIAGMKDDTTRRGQDIHADTAREALNGRMETAKFIQKSIAERQAAGAASKQELAEYVQGELDKRQVYGFDRKEDIAKMVQDALNMRQGTGLAAKASEGALNRDAGQKKVETQQAGALERAELGAKTRTNIAANKPPSATEIKITNQAQRYDVATQTIDDAFKDIKTALKSGLSPTGAGGKARSLQEVLGTLSGLSDSTVANQFKQKIELLRAEVPRLLTGGAGAYMNKEEQARVTRIVRGLELGDTTQITVDDLDYLKKHLGALKPKAGVIKPKEEKSGAPDAEGWVTLPDGARYREKK